MSELEGKNFFDNIRRTVKISHFVASIIPLALLVYFAIYVAKDSTGEVPVHIGILLVLAVAVSVLGLILMTKSTNSSIVSAQDLYKKLNSLFGITKQFRETLYLDVLLGQIMQSAIELNDAESGSLLLYDEKDNLKYRVNFGENAEKMDNKIIEPGKGVASWVAEKGEPALINDISGDSRFSLDFDSETGFETRSAMCVPLIHAGEVIGAIVLRNKKSGPFTKEDEALLHSLADQASISITQNRMNEKQHSDFIHITEILVGAQDYIQNKKGHARRVANYANLIGKQLNFSDPELRRLYHASLLHDVGMLKVDTNDHKVKEKVMQHPQLGHDLIKSISLWNDLADIILNHHERYDGTGYPMAKKEDDIPIEARILLVADTFDELTNSYSSQKQLDYGSALDEIETHSGTQFDPEIVQALKASISDAGLI